MLSDRSGAFPSRRRAATARILCSDCGETRLETADRERCGARVHPLTRAGHACAFALCTCSMHQGTIRCWLDSHHKVCFVPAYMRSRCGVCACAVCAGKCASPAGGARKEFVEYLTVCVSAAIFERDMRRHRHMPSDRVAHHSGTERNSEVADAGRGGVIWWTRCTLYAGFRPRQEPRVSVVLHQHHAQHAKRRLDRGLDVLIVLICAEQRWHARGLGLERGFQP